MSNKTDKPRTRTITLTGRAPVRIVEARWPILAEAHGDSDASGDYSRHEQRMARGEVDKYHLVARQHDDGRTLVYAVMDAAIAAWGAPAGGEDYRGGYLLAKGEDVAAALARVGQEAGLPAELIREAVADLPAEELDAEESFVIGDKTYTEAELEEALDDEAEAERLFFVVYGREPDDASREAGVASHVWAGVRPE